MLIAVVTESEEEKSSILEIFLNAVVAIAQLVAQSSYIGTNIIMMVSYVGVVQLYAHCQYCDVVVLCYLVVTPLIYLSKVTVV